MPLITASEARDFLPALTGTGEDSLLERLISRAGTLFARHCGYPPASAGASPTMQTATYTRYLDGRGGRDLSPDILPVQSITSIYDDLLLDFGASTLVSSDDYALLSDGEVSRVRLTSTATHGVWQRGEGNCKATFVAGFATVPDDLKLACALMVRHWYDLRQVVGKSSQSGGNVSIGLRDETIPDSVRQLLSAYRLPRILG